MKFSNIAVAAYAAYAFAAPVAEANPDALAFAEAHADADASAEAEAGFLKKLLKLKKCKYFGTCSTTTVVPVVTTPSTTTTTTGTTGSGGSGGSGGAGGAGGSGGSTTGTTNGNSGTTNGNSGTTNGNSGTTNGNSGTTNGNSGTTSGNTSGQTTTNNSGQTNTSNNVATNTNTANNVNNNTNNNSNTNNNANNNNNNNANTNDNTNGNTNNNGNTNVSGNTNGNTGLNSNTNYQVNFASAFNVATFYVLPSGLITLSAGYGGVAFSFTISGTSLIASAPGFSNGYVIVNSNGALQVVSSSTYTVTWISEGGYVTPSGGTIVACPDNAGSYILYSNVSCSGGKVVAFLTDDFADKAAEWIPKVDPTYSVLDTDSWYKAVLQEIPNTASIEDLKETLYNFNDYHIVLNTEPKIISRNQFTQTALVSFRNAQDYAKCADNLIIQYTKVKVRPFISRKKTPEELQAMRNKIRLLKNESDKKDNEAHPVSTDDSQDEPMKETNIEELDESNEEENENNSITSNEL